MAEASPQPQTSTAGISPGAGTASPPPNCAICLGNCINKCFSDSCMHQFCFKCLLEWSKVKAVCPLCKQPFTSIIHNVKSNNEYDEHFIVSETNNIAEDDFDEHFIVRAPERRTGYDFFLPTVPTTSRHFQFRTTFTVDPRGELAIQQLLSTHPLTTSSYEYVSPINFHSRSRRRIHGDVSTTNFRRFIYAQDLWANSPPDITGRYRDISPQYYRENQAAKTRIAPWLNRELNALIEPAQTVVYLTDVILGQLSRHHVTSRYFKQLLAEYLHDRTDHFIHELYNFMRSPFSMISYDTQMFYIQGRPHLSIHLSEESSSSDSDVAVVSVENTDPVVIEINSDSSRDSDVIFREPTPPVVVDLINSDSNDTIIVPAKNKKKRRLEDVSSTNGFTPRKHKLKRKYKKSKYYIVKEQSDSDSSDNEPLCVRLKRKKDERRRKKLRKLEKRRRSELKAACYNNNNNSKNDASTNTVYDCFKHENSDSERTCPSYTPPPALPVLKDENLFTPGILGEITPSHTVTHKSEKVEEKCGVSALAAHDNIINFNPGPSGSNVSPGNSWYLRPIVYGSSDETSD